MLAAYDAPEYLTFRRSGSHERSRHRLAQHLYRIVQSLQLLLRPKLAQRTSCVSATVLLLLEQCPSRNHNVITMEITFWYLQLRVWFKSKWLSAFQFKVFVATVIETRTQGIWAQ